MPAKSGREVIPARGSRGSLFFLSKSSNRTAAAAANSAPAEKPMMPILFGIDVPFLGVSAHQADRLQSIVDFVGLRIVTVAPQAIAQDDGVDAVVVEEGNEIGASLPTFSVLCPPPAARITAAPVLIPRSTVWTSIEGL